MKGRAEFDATGRYRYWLERDWRGGTVLAFLMLNPSTASATRDDPTIRRCMKFAEREGHGRLIVVNLFAFRSTDPNTLLDVDDPVGPDNDGWIDRAASGASVVVEAWGAFDMARERGAEVGHRIAQVAPVFMLGLTAHGQPRHPLYVRADAPLIRLVSRNKDGTVGGLK